MTWDRLETALEYLIVVLLFAIVILPLWLVGSLWELAKEHGG